MCRLMTDMTKLEAKVELLTEQLASKEREMIAIASKVSYLNSLLNDSTHRHHTYNMIKDAVVVGPSTWIFVYSFRNLLFLCII